MIARDLAAESIGPVKAALDAYVAERTPRAARVALPWVAAQTAHVVGADDGAEAARAADALAELIAAARVDASSEEIAIVDRIAARSVDWAASRGVRSDALVAVARDPRPPTAWTLVRVLRHATGH